MASASGIVIMETNLKMKCLNYAAFECAWRGREHCTTIKSQIHFKDLLHSKDSFSKIFVRASPRSSSRAAREEFRSDFQEDIKRWQTKWAALTNSEPKRIISMLIKVLKGDVWIELVQGHQFWLHRVCSCFNTSFVNSVFF